MITSTLKPGLLVSLKTVLSGNVSYRKVDIDPEHAIEGTEAAREATWQTTRTTSDAQEFERARKARSAAVYEVAKVCAATAFGMLCPEAKRAELDAGIARGRAIVDEFNASARITRISLYVITGRVAQDDAEAIRSIRAEVGSLLSDMKEGIDGLSAEKVRDAAKRAKEIAEMLSDESRASVQEAIEAARAAARAITKAAKAGEVAAAEIDASAIATLNSARLAFLDVSDAREVAAPVVQERALDLAPEGLAIVPNPVAVPAIELEG